MNSKKHLIFLSGNFLSLQETSEDDVLEFTLTYTTPVGNRTVKYINNVYNGDIIEHMNPDKSEFNNVQFIKNNYENIYRDGTGDYEVISDISNISRDILEYMKDNKTAYSVDGHIQFVIDVAPYCWTKFIKTVFGNFPFNLGEKNISYIPFDMSSLFDIVYKDIDMSRLNLYNKFMSENDYKFINVTQEDTVDGFVKNRMMTYLYDKMMQEVIIL